MASAIQVIKKIFQQVGVDIRAYRKTPDFTLLGLRNLPIGTIIDVGANRGQFAQKYTSIFPNANFFCFEPLPEPFLELKKWSKKNSHVTIFNIALGAVNGSFDMFYHVEHDTSSSLLQSTDITSKLYPFTKKQKKIQIESRKMDDFLSEYKLSTKDNILIKLDVQGYENRVIEGGKTLFSMAKACIIEVSLDQLYEGQADFNELVNVLYELGYVYSGNLDQKYGKDGHCIYLDAVFVTQPRH